MALGAISGGVGAGMNAAFGTSGGFLQSVGRQVLGNALTQGIAVATGLQKKFDWKGVAGAAVGAAASYGMGNVLGENTAHPAFGTSPFGNIARDTLKGFVSGVASSAVRGGKIDVASIASDAFGNALGNSVVGAMNAPQSSGEAKLAEAYNGGAAWAADVARRRAEYGWYTQAGANVQGSVYDTEYYGMPLEPAAPQTHTLQNGDSLYKVAAKYYPNNINAGVAMIAAANISKIHGTDAYGNPIIRTGDVLDIPEAKGDLSSAAKAGGRIIATNQKQHDATAKALEAQRLERIAIENETRLAEGNKYLIDPATGKESFFYSSRVARAMADAQQQVQTGGYGSPGAYLSESPAVATNTTGVRIHGAIQAFSGVLGGIASSGAIVTGAALAPSTFGAGFLLSVAGYTGLLASCDQFSAGIRTVWTGEAQRTFSGLGIQYITGASPQTAEFGAGLLMFSPAAGEAYVLNQSTRAFAAYTSASRATSVDLLAEVAGTKMVYRQLATEASIASDVRGIIQPRVVANEGAALANTGRLRPGSLSNKEVRDWYVENVKDIGNRINPNASLKEQALEAYQMRTDIRKEARVLMSDRKLAESLPDMPSLKDIVRRKYENNLVGDNLWRDVIRSARTPNANVNKMFGIH